MQTQSEENYLKAIFKLTSGEVKLVSTGNLALALGVNAASVSEKIKKLSQKKWIEYKKSKGVKLTEKGRKLAVQIVRKHRLWEYFLVEKLKFKWDEVHGIAEELEHIKNEELVDKLDLFLGHPKYDPHGDPIPDKNGNFAKDVFSLLIDSGLRQTVVMSGVLDHGSEFLRYLNKIQLGIGEEMQIIERFEYDNSLRVRLTKKKKELQLSRQVAENILVKNK